MEKLGALVEGDQVELGEQEHVLGYVTPWIV
jgi:hypothetical protein